MRRQREQQVRLALAVEHVGGRARIVQALRQGRVCRLQVIDESAIDRGGTPGGVQVGERKTVGEFEHAKGDLGAPHRYRGRAKPTILPASPLPGRTVQGICLSPRMWTTRSPPPVAHQPVLAAGLGP